jgi:hypothetical protein
VKITSPTWVTTGSQVCQVFTATNPPTANPAIRTSRFTQSQATPTTPGSSSS